jgi:hypothetical protein
MGQVFAEEDAGVVFAGLVGWTEKKPKPNPTQLKATGPSVAVASFGSQFSCWLLSCGIFKNRSKTGYNWNYGTYELIKKWDKWVNERIVSRVFI